MALNQRRMLSSQIWEDEKFNKLNANQKLLYIGMITLGDDDGRFKADERYLSAKIFPYTRMTPNRIKQFCEQIYDIGLIELYPTEKGLIGIHPKWSNHQQIRKERYKPSQFLLSVPPNQHPDGTQETAQVNLSESNLIEESGREFNEIEFPGSRQLIDAIPDGLPIKRQITSNK